MYTSLFGHFAATDAAARVLKLDATQTVNALGIAYSQAREPSGDARRGADQADAAGLCRQGGAHLGQLTARRQRGAAPTFEGADGLFRVYLRGRRPPCCGRARRALRVARLSYKPYPCCRFNHTAIGAALGCATRGRSHGLAGVRASALNHQADEAVCTPIAMREAPATIVQAQFSIPFTVACALHRGAVTLADFTDEGIRDAEVRATAGLVEVVVDPEIERESSRSISPTRLSVETDEGIVEARVDRPRGDAARPMSRRDFDAKMQGCLEFSGAVWPSDMIAGLHDAIDGLDGAAGGARGIVSRMTSAGSASVRRAAAAEVA